MYEVLVKRLRHLEITAIYHDEGEIWRKAVAEAADAIEELNKGRPTGRWIRTRMPVTGAIEHRCSRCDTPYYMAFAMEMNYCPSCGAKMEVHDGQEKQ